MTILEHYSEVFLSPIMSVATTLARWLMWSPQFLHHMVIMGAITSLGHTTLGLPHWISFLPSIIIFHARGAPLTSPFTHQLKFQPREYILWIWGGDWERGFGALRFLTKFPVYRHFPPMICGGNGILARDCFFSFSPVSEKGLLP